MRSAMVSRLPRANSAVKRPMTASTRYQPTASDTERLVTCAGLRGSELTNGPTVSADNDRISPCTVPPSSCTWPPSDTASPRTVPPACTTTSPSIATALPVTVPRTSSGPCQDAIDPLTVFPAAIVCGPCWTTDFSMTTPFASRASESTTTSIESLTLTTGVGRCLPCGAADADALTTSAVARSAALVNTGCETMGV